MSEHRCRTVTYQEDHRYVEQEGNEGVRKEREDADAVDVAHGHAGNLNDQGDHAVDDSTSRGVVVKRNEGIHLELGGAQHALDHDETQSLENDTTALVYTAQVSRQAMGIRAGSARAPVVRTDEADQVELDLAKGSNNDTKDNNAHVSKDLHVWRGNAESPCGEQGDNGVGGLQHLNE